MPEWIFDAIERNDAAAVAASLDRDKKLATAKDDGGRTPLHVAAELGHAAIVGLLLDWKAKLDAKDKQHRTALDRAALAGHDDVARLLRSRGASPNVKVPKDYSALHEALYMVGPAPARLLIELGSDPNLAWTGYGDRKPPLHLALEASRIEFTKTPGIRADVVRALLRAGADPDATNGKGDAPLHRAAENGHADCVVALLEAGARIEQADADGATPLFFAVLGGHLASVRALLDRGAGVNATLPPSAKDLAGRTPLGMARTFGHRFVERLLIARGAGDPQRVEPAVSRPTEIHTAAWNGDVDDLRAILDADPSQVDAVAAMGLIAGTPLNKAATAGRLEAVQLLLSRGASVQNDRTDCYTPLRDAAVQGNAEIIRALAAAGANVDHNPDGRPPLIEATTFAIVASVRALLEAGADANVKDDEGRTPLWLLKHDNRLGKPGDVDACVALITVAGGHE